MAAAVSMAVCEEERQTHPQPGQPGAADFCLRPTRIATAGVTWLSGHFAALHNTVSSVPIVVLPGESLPHLVVKQEGTAQ